MLAAIFAVLRWTRLGLIARGTMQNADMAAALGVNPTRVYAVTFGIGAALSGLAGAVLAPVSGVFPTIGVAYVAKSFITVIGGGAAILSGTVSRVRLVRHHQSGRHLRHHAGVRGGGAAGGRDCPDPPAAAGHHRALLPERPVKSGRLNVLGLALVGVVGLAFLFLTPRFAELDTILELTIYMIMAILALSLALIWGYGGILCFGQSAFFGLGAYTYAIAMFNIGESTVPLLLAIIAAGGLCRAARLFHVLWPHQRRLSRRHHADGDA